MCQVQGVLQQQMQHAQLQEQERQQPQQQQQMQRQQYSEMRLLQRSHYIKQEQLRYLEQKLRAGAAASQNLNPAVTPTPPDAGFPPQLDTTIDLNAYPMGNHSYHSAAEAPTDLEGSPPSQDSGTPSFPPLEASNQGRNCDRGQSPHVQVTTTPVFTPSTAQDPSVGSWILPPPPSQPLTPLPAHPTAHLGTSYDWMDEHVPEYSWNKSMPSPSAATMGRITALSARLDTVPFTSLPQARLLVTVLQAIEHRTPSQLAALGVPYMEAATPPHAPAVSSIMEDATTSVAIPLDCAPDEGLVESFTGISNSTGLLPAPTAGTNSGSNPHWTQPERPEEGGGDGGDDNDGLERGESDGEGLQPSAPTPDMEVDGADAASPPSFRHESDEEEGDAAMLLEDSLRSRMIAMDLGPTIELPGHRSLGPGPIIGLAQPAAAPFRGAPELGRRIAGGNPLDVRLNPINLT